MWYFVDVSNESQPRKSMASLYSVHVTISEPLDFAIPFCLELSVVFDSLHDRPSIAIEVDRLARSKRML